TFAARAETWCLLAHSPTSSHHKVLPLFHSIICFRPPPSTAHLLRTLVPARRWPLLNRSPVKRCPRAWALTGLDSPARKKWWVVQRTLFSRWLSCLFIVPWRDNTKAGLHRLQ